MCPLLPVLAPTEDENEPDISINDNGDIGVVVVILAVDDEAAESIEICQPTELSLLLTSSAILFWLNAGFSSTVTNWYQDVIFSCLKDSLRIRSLRSDDDCEDRSRSVSLPGSSPNWDPKT